ncbi:MAG TPA: hypothetical protein VGE39_24510 [Prosthecobacter sp.]
MKSNKKAPKTCAPSREETLAALKLESDLDLRDQIRRRLALPIEKRMNFLRVRLPGGGSCL